jgi:hypothetical protein
MLMKLNFADGNGLKRRTFQKVQIACVNCSTDDGGVHEKLNYRFKTDGLNKSASMWFNFWGLSYHERSASVGVVTVSAPALSIRQFKWLHAAKSPAPC